ncbi:nudix hydrolase [Diaporthe sp. PMI_573]|nr:nudix hydrolase [Diaporthaceae sp. PMI_573]
MADTVFVLDDYNNVSVTAQGLERDQLTQWAPFMNWISTLFHSLSLQERPLHPFHNNPYRLKDITIESYTLFKANNIGFLKLSADVSTADGKNRLPGTISLRGPAVAMLVVLIPEDNQRSDADALDKAYVLLTVQPRIPTGSLGFVELPAGIMDGDSNFAGVAAREIEEELGLVIKQDELTCLTDKVAEMRRARNESNETGIGSGSKLDSAGADENLTCAMYPSAGGCDEFIKIFSLERRVPRSTLHEWEGKYGGLRVSTILLLLRPYDLFP